MLRHIVLVFLCVTVAVTSGWRLKFNIHKNGGWFHRFDPCPNYLSGRVLSLLLENGYQGNFIDALDSICQCVGDQLQFCDAISTPYNGIKIARMPTAYKRHFSRNSADECWNSFVEDLCSCDENILQFICPTTTTPTTTTTTTPTTTTTTTPTTTTTTTPTTTTTSKYRY
ncbi:hypothetical protein LSH36_2071g00000 [Paralvinella palmiformis]|uniref:Uncharacterized protein n=1 Tax=Paralvinella palmiformis TaxID=53620 RepID=A0AAD9IQL7_9ANNE|nr:hypothetical protein LSH36_2071g00000 [Paralvinella palmiformis]